MTRRLTPRETEVHAQLCAGKANKEIAQALGISVRTAAFHVSALLRKAGVHSRLEYLVKNLRATT